MWFLIGNNGHKHKIILKAIKQSVIDHVIQRQLSNNSKLKKN